MAGTGLFYRHHDRTRWDEDNREHTLRWDMPGSKGRVRDTLHKVLWVKSIGF